MRVLSFIFFLTLATATSGQAYEKGSRIGINVNSLAEAEDLGYGFLYVYEFILKESFVLGIDLELRQMTPELFQLGYGLLMKHYVSEQAYLEYGLLMSVSRIQDRKGSGTAHDTRLALGRDWEMAGKALFAELSYHYSRLRFFESPKTNLDYLQAGFGLRHNW